MLAENKVQLEAIKTRNYMCGEFEDCFMVTNGCFIVYIKQKDFLLDCEKFRKLKKEEIKCFSPENVEKGLIPAEMSKRMYDLGNKKAKGVKNKETGKYYWFDISLMNLFKECQVWLHEAKTEENALNAVFTRYGEVVGYVLPVRVSDEWA